MKIHLTMPAMLTGLLILCAAPALATAIRVGDPAAKVDTLLGEPRGSIRSEGYAMLLYDRGRVEILDGLVTAVNLLSPEEAEALRLAEAERAAERRAVEAERRERLVEEGQAMKARMLADPDFMRADAATQLDTWKRFIDSYPDVPAEAQYVRALARREAELEREAEAMERQATERRLAAMEQRVAEAERRAREAEASAAAARRDRQYVSYYVSNPVVRYPVYPVHTSVYKHTPTRAPAKRQAEREPWAKRRFLGVPQQPIGIDGGRKHGHRYVTDSCGIGSVYTTAGGLTRGYGYDHSSLRLNLRF